MAAQSRAFKKFYLLIAGIPLAVSVVIGKVFSEAIRKKLEPKADSLLDFALTTFERGAGWVGTREVGWAVAAILFALLLIKHFFKQKNDKATEDDEEAIEKAQNDFAAILKDLAAGIRETAETQKTLWMQEKNSLVAHKEEIAQQAKSLEEQLQVVHEHAESAVEALEFLQWACIVARDQADRYARQHIRIGMEMVKELLISLLLKRDDPDKMGDAWITGMQGGNMPKGVNLQRAYRIGAILNCFIELYSSVESLAAFPNSIFNDHFEHPELTTEQLLDRWDERRHPETVIFEVMDEVFKSDWEGTSSSETEPDSPLDTPSDPIP